MKTASKGRAAARGDKRSKDCFLKAAPVRSVSDLWLLQLLLLTETRAFRIVPEATHVVKLREATGV